MVRSTDRPAMTIAVELGRKATKQTKNLLPTNMQRLSAYRARLEGSRDPTPQMPNDVVGKRQIQPLHN